MHLAGMSDEDWGEEDLDIGYHPISMTADKPPVMEDERIEGAQSALPPDEYSQGDAGGHAETIVGTTRQPSADDILVAESQYGNPEEENELTEAKGGDYDVVVEETYYEHREEELDYDDDPSVEEDMVIWDDDDDPDNDADNGNADDEEENDLADDDNPAESIRPKEGEYAAVWGWLGTPVGDQSTTDTETGKTADLMKSVLIRSPEGDQNAGKDKSRRSRHSDREPTVLSDSSWPSRDYSSDSSRSSCITRRHDRKEEKRSEPPSMNQLNLPESTTPWQSPQQKQIKMTELSSRPTATAPTVSSVIQMAEMPVQDLMRTRLNDMEKRIPGVSGEPAPPSSRSQRRSDMGLRPQRLWYSMTQRLRLKQMETLCIHHRDEYICHMMYEVNMDRYDHFKDDLKVLGNNAEEMIRQVIATCVWAYEHYHLTERIEDPYIPTCFGPRRLQWIIGELLWGALDVVMTIMLR